MPTRRAKVFLTLAREELTAARRCVPDLPRQAAYFAQQSIEKIARAVVEHHGFVVGRTHDIAAIAMILPEDNA